MIGFHDELVALCRDMNAAGERLTYAARLKRRGGGRNVISLGHSGP